MSPGKLLKEYITSYIKENNLPEYLMTEIPKKWEKYGDFVLFDERTLCNSVWKKQDEHFWLKVCEILKCKRVGMKNRIKNDGYRSPNVTILIGSDPWVLHKDNSIIYSWNIQHCMFSAGNITEKLRIANLNCENEIIVDLFAGIGYFTLPFLVHSKASFVHACEWNPFAIEALKRNLSLNKLITRCKIYEGDNRLVCPKKIAQRINLGLIPSSENFWEVACAALVEEGGILHIHENVETKKQDILCSNCQILMPEMDMKNISMNNKDKVITFGNSIIMWKHKQWLIKGIHILHSIISIYSNKVPLKLCHVTINKVNFVKSYAPFINHLVYDIKVESQNSSENESTSLKV